MSATGNLYLVFIILAVCTVACLPQNYSESEMKLMKLLNRTTLSSNWTSTAEDPNTNDFTP